MQIMMGVSSSSWLKHTRRISLILNVGATQSFNNTDLEKKFAGFISRFVDILSPMAVGVAIIGNRWRCDAVSDYHSDVFNTTMVSIITAIVIQATTLG
uniref:Uncharacterized protein n=1 Tax=Helianthus annuus TaxID=4232 RepID=A0A251VQK3_HELAN